MRSAWSPPSTAAPIVCVITIDLDGGVSDTLEIRADDAPPALAALFIAKHGLEPEMQGPLADHVQQHMQLGMAKLAAALRATTPVAPPPPPPPAPLYMTSRACCACRRRRARALRVNSG